MKVATTTVFKISVHREYNASIDRRTMEANVKAALERAVHSINHLSDVPMGFELIAAEALSSITETKTVTETLQPQRVNR